MFVVCARLATDYSQYISLSSSQSIHILYCDIYCDIHLVRFVGLTLFWGQ